MKVARKTACFSFFGFVLFLLQLFSFACSSTVNLRQTPSDLVLLSIQPNNKSAVKYDFVSKYPGSYTYRNSSGYAFIFPINSTFKNNLDMYMTSKFSNVSQQSSCNIQYVVDVKLDSIDVQYKLQQDLLEGLSGSGGNMIVNAFIKVNLVTTHADSLLGQKTIITTTQSNKPLKKGDSVDSVYAEAINDAVSKCIILMDKYFVSIGL